MLSSLRSKKAAGLWIDTGLGKTIISLDTIVCMLLSGEIENATVVAPARVIDTAWPKEIEEWRLPLTWEWLQGDEESLTRKVQSKPDIFFISAENLVLRKLSDEAKARRTYMQLAEWLVAKKFKTDIIFIDEVTKFKNWTSGRTKVLKHLLKRIPLRVTLTGTPAANGLGDIFAQQFILDSGATLGSTIGGFRDKFMRSCGYEDREFELRPEMEETLRTLIAPWYLHQAAVEHLDMPDKINNEILIELPPKAKEAYKKMEKEMYAELDEATSLIAMSGGAKYNLCRQIASGAAYFEDGYKEIHSAKLDMLEEVVEGCNGKTVLIAYWYAHEGDRILKRFPKAEIIRGGVRNTKEIVDRFKSGKTQIVVAQASCISHGVDGLQRGGCGDVIWYSQTDQPEVRYQFEARVWRQGNAAEQVRFHHLLAKSTVDVKIKRVCDDKNATQAELFEKIRLDSVSSVS